MTSPANLVDEHAVLLRYGSSLCHSLYNSMEVGQRAAGSIAAAFSSPFMGNSVLPKLSCGRMAKLHCQAVATSCVLVLPKHSPPPQC